ncbi:C-type lectin domain family 4 member M-like [Pyxicephalus adspersus]|uniref:C-type lectin domain family 4 member M-like n=1 Tax=Pyxicephalus adspersus TaxID=30357 RepID=UPI003B5A2E7C
MLIYLRIAGGEARRDCGTIGNWRLYNQTEQGLSLRCLDLWIYINNKCYFLSETQKSYSESSKDCAERGSRLAQVKESNMKRLVAITGKEFWIGLSQYNTHGVWTGKWEDGSKETISEGVRSCAKLGSHLTREICYIPLYWICERDLDRPH